MPPEFAVAHPPHLHLAKPAAIEMRDAWSYGRIAACLEAAGDGFVARYMGNSLSSHFQPIVSLTHSRIVGHEALLRGNDPQGQALPPLQLIEQAERDGSLIRLDRLARVLHVANGRGTTEQGWLFLNMHPVVFSQLRSVQGSGFMRALLDDYGIDPQQVVIEVLEASIRDVGEFRDTVAALRELGCLIALDDFGAGQSNFDRVWQTAPEIVKLDRSFAAQAELDPRVRRLLPRIVALLHESGAFVLLEGIENETQALIALEAGIDFAQGYYFGRPAALPRTVHSTIDTADALWRHYDVSSRRQTEDFRATIQPYQEAISLAAMRLSIGDDFAEACDVFLGLENAELCYRLDEDGFQIGDNLWRGEGLDARRARFRPVAGIDGARWSRRPYFRRAYETPGRIQTTRPYLSSASARMCVTLSVAYSIKGRIQVLCGDVAWD